MSGSHRQLVAIVVVLLLIGLFAWFSCARDSRFASLQDAAPMQTPAPDIAKLESDAGDHAELQREAAPTEPTDRRVRIRLAGFSPSIPWTEDLHFDLNGYSAPGGQHQIERHLVVSENGTASFEPPELLDDLVRGSFTITCKDPNYRPIYHMSDSLAVPGEEIVIEVEPVTVLRGRVVDADGKPVVAADVSALEHRHGYLIPDSGGSVCTDFSGRFTIQVEPGRKHVVIAAAMVPDKSNGAFMRSGNGIANTGQPRPEWLPAWLDVSRATLVDGQLPDLVLARAAPVRGVLRWRNGDPIPNAWVTTWDRSGYDGPKLSSNLAIGDMLRNGPEVLPGTTTNARGEFALPAEPGQRLHIRSVLIHGVLGSIPIDATSEPAPARLDLTVRDTTLRAVREGRPVPSARFDLPDGTFYIGDDEGRVRVATELWGVRARDDVYASRWVMWEELDAATEVLDLELEPRRTAVTLKFDDPTGIHSVGVQWQEGPGQRASMRDFVSVSECDLLYLPRGPVTLWIGGGSGLGAMILRTPYQIEVGTQPLEVSVEPQYGGRLLLTVTAADRPIAGTFKLFDDQGNALRGCFKSRRDHYTIVAGAEGEFAAAARQLFDYPLPGGNYVLEVATATYSRIAHERREFTIVPRESTTVAIDLP